MRYYFFKNKETLFTPLPSLSFRFERLNSESKSFIIRMHFLKWYWDLIIDWGIEEDLPF